MCNVQRIVGACDAFAIPVRSYIIYGGIEVIEYVMNITGPILDLDTFTLDIDTCTLDIDTFTPDIVTLTLPEGL